MADQTEQTPDYSGHLEADGSVSYARVDSFGTEMDTEPAPDLAEQQAALEAERAGLYADQYAYPEGGAGEYQGYDEQPEYADPNEYGSDPLDQMVQEQIAQEFQPLRDEYGIGAEQYDQGPTVGEAVADAVSDTTISPQQQAAFNQLVEQQPELNHPVVLQVMEPIMEQLAEEHGLDVAVHPTTVQAVFQAIGGPEAFRDEIEEFEIVQGMFNVKPTRDAFS